MQWIECYPDGMDKGRQFVAVSDGVTTFCAIGDDIDALIADYVATYGFNTPGDVHCAAKLYYGDEEAWPAEARKFTIRSDDGRDGYLVA